MRHSLWAFYVLIPLSLSAFDFPAPKNAATVTYTYSSFSWDNSKGWVLLPSVKIIKESFDAQSRIATREISDSKGMLIEKTIFAYSSLGYRKTTYDGKNQIMRIANVEISGSASMETVKRADNSIFAEYKTELGPNGFPVTEEYFDPSGTLIWRIGYSWDGAVCTRILYSNPDGSVALEAVYGYKDPDPLGNWTSCTQALTYADVRSRPKEYVQRKVAYR